MATQDGSLAKANKGRPQHQASPNGKVNSDHDIGQVAPVEESWLWKAYGVNSLGELKLKYGVDEIQGCTAEEASRVREDIRVNGLIPLAVVKRELGFD